MTKLNKTQQAIIANIADDCGTMRAPIDGLRMTLEAQKLVAAGYGRFVPDGGWDRSGNGRVATYNAGGWFYLEA